MRVSEFNRISIQVLDTGWKIKKKKSKFCSLIYINLNIVMSRLYIAQKIEKEDSISFITYKLKILSKMPKERLKRGISKLLQ